MNVPVLADRQLCADTGYGLERWIIGMDGLKESGNSVLPAQLGDDV